MVAQGGEVVQVSAAGAPAAVAADSVRPLGRSKDAVEERPHAAASSSPPGRADLRLVVVTGGESRVASVMLLVEVPAVLVLLLVLVLLIVLLPAVVVVVVVVGAVVSAGHPASDCRSSLAEGELLAVEEGAASAAASVRES